MKALPADALTVVQPLQHTAPDADLIFVLSYSG